jgi:hypothetical protein
MLLWNSLLPEIFGLQQLNYLQATGLLVLARILFGGHIGGLGGDRHHRGHHFHRNHLREKWMNMSEEERKEFAEKGMHRHHFSHRHGCHKNGESPKNEETGKS